MWHARFSIHKILAKSIHVSMSSSVGCCSGILGGKCIGAKHRPNRISLGVNFVPRMILSLRFSTTSLKKSGQFLGIDCGSTSWYSDSSRSGAHFFFRHDKKSLLTSSMSPFTQAAYAGVTILMIPSLSHMYLFQLLSLEV